MYTKIKKLINSVFNKKNDQENELTSSLKKHDERVLRGAMSTEDYSIKTFEKIWELINFSDNKMLGIDWGEKDRAKIEKSIDNMNLELRNSKSPALIGFNLEFIQGDTVDGTIALIKNRNIICSFSFIDKNATELVNWVEKKYGKSLNLRDETSDEYYYDWISGDVLITIDLVKSSGLADITLEKKPEYIKMIHELAENK